MELALCALCGKNSSLDSIHVCEIYFAYSLLDLCLYVLEDHHFECSPALNEDHNAFALFFARAEPLIPDLWAMRLSIIVPLAITILMAACSKQILESKWHVPSKVETNFRFYHADSKIRYNVTNDSTHLFLKMDVTDRLTIMKILQTGMRVFLGADGKKKERNELQFPIYVDKYELTQEDLNPAMYDIDRKGQLERMLPTEGYLKYNGGVAQVFNGTPLADGTQVHIRLDSDRALVYEAIIPLKLLETKSGQVALGIETGAFKFPTGDVIQQSDITSQNQQLTAGDRAMGRGQGGMDPYGGNPYGMSPNSSANMGMNQRSMTRYNVMEESVRFWMNVQLAAQ